MSKDMVTTDNFNLVNRRNVQNIMARIPARQENNSYFARSQTKIKKIYRGNSLTSVVSS